MIREEPLKEDLVQVRRCAKAVLALETQLAFMHRPFGLLLLFLSYWYALAAFREVHLEYFSPQMTTEFLDFIKEREVLHIPKNTRNTNYHDRIPWPEKGLNVNLHFSWGKCPLIPGFYRKRNWSDLFTDERRFELFSKIEKHLRRIKPINENEDWFRAELAKAFSQRQGEPVPHVIRNAVNNLLSRTLALGHEKLQYARGSIKRAVEVEYGAGSYGDA